MTGYDHGGYVMYLSQVPMFRHCSSEELEQVASLAIPKQVKAGDTLVRQGDLGDEFFVVAMGNVKVERDGKEVATLGPGAFFGELALFDPATRNATVTATSTATVLVLHRDRFRELLGDAPTIRDGLLRGMAHRLHELDSHA